MAKVPKQWQKNKDAIIASGDNLLNNFRSAQMSSVIIATVKHKAKITEDAALSILNSIEASNKIYLSSKDISPEQFELLSRASTESHFRKVQAKQIDEYGSSQLDNMELEAQSNYLGRRILVRKKDKKYKCIYTYMRDTRTGRSFFSRRHPSQARGTIKEINLQENFIIVKPSLSKKLLNQSTECYFVYVIDPNSLDAMVSLSIA